MQRRYEIGLLIALLLTALFACKKQSPDPAPAPAPTESEESKRGKELRPKVKQRLAAIAALKEKAKSEPQVKADKPFETKLEKKQFVVLGDQWLDDVHFSPNEYEIDLKDTTLSLCGHQREEETQPTADQIKWMEECTDWKYAAVIRPKKVVWPKVVMEAKKYSPGEVTGDMLLFEIESGEVKGRYRFRITNSDEITGSEDQEHGDWTKKAREDLAENVIGVVEERLEHERDTMGH